MERMINDCLCWNLVREGYLNGENVVSIFFDLEKAYDTTSKYGIMKGINKMDLRGRLPLFIKNLLSERKFRIRVGTSFSDFSDQEMRVLFYNLLLHKHQQLQIMKINTYRSL